MEEGYSGEWEGGREGEENKIKIRPLDHITTLTYSITLVADDRNKSKIIRVMSSSTNGQGGGRG